MEGGGAGFDDEDIGVLQALAQASCKGISCRAATDDDLDTVS
jgi:hypothetical protein